MFGVQQAAAPHHTTTIRWWATTSSSPQLTEPHAGVWTIQRNPDGTRFYYNRALNASKAQLSEEEQQLLVPELDAYDNDVVMPLKVRPERDCSSQRFTTCAVGFLAAESFQL